MLKVTPEMWNFIKDIVLHKDRVLFTSLQLLCFRIQKEIKIVTR